MLKEFVENYSKKHGLTISGVRKLCAEAMYPDDNYFNRNNKFGFIFNGKYKLKAEQVKMICDALKIQPNEFFNIQPPKIALYQEQVESLCEILNLQEKE